MSTPFRITPSPCLLRVRCRRRFDFRGFADPIQCQYSAMTGGGPRCLGCPKKPPRHAGGVLAPVTLLGPPAPSGCPWGTESGVGRRDDDDLQVCQLFQLTMACRSPFAAVEMLNGNGNSTRDERGFGLGSSQPISMMDQSQVISATPPPSRRGPFPSSSLPNFPIPSSFPTRPSQIRIPALPSRPSPSPTPTFTRKFSNAPSLLFTIHINAHALISPPSELMDGHKETQGRKHALVAWASGSPAIGRHLGWLRVVPEWLGNIPRVSARPNCNKRTHPAGVKGKDVRVSSGSTSARGRGHTPPTTPRANGTRRNLEKNSRVVGAKVGVKVKVNSGPRSNHAFVPLGYSKWGIHRRGEGRQCVVAIDGERSRHRTE